MSNIKVEGVFARRSHMDTPRGKNKSAALLALSSKHDKLYIHRMRWSSHRELDKAIDKLNGMEPRVIDPAIWHEVEYVPYVMYGTIRLLTGETLNPGFGAPTSDEFSETPQALEERTLPDLVQIKNGWTLLPE